MDNYAALRDATLGAQQIQAPGGNPLGASNAPELAKLFTSSFQLPQSEAATKAQAFNTGTTVANQQQAEAEARQAEAARLKAEAQKIQDESDPSKYTLKKKEDGGFDFFDPHGNQVDIATYAKKTGVKPADVLKDSENPIDIQFVHDYNNLNDLLSAVVNKDTDKLDSYRQQFEAQGLPDITKQKPHDIIEQFHKYYQRMYVPRQQDPQAWGVTPNSNIFIPNQKVTSSNYPSLSGGVGI